MIGLENWNSVNGEETAIKVRPRSNESDILVSHIVRRIAASMLAVGTGKGELWLMELEQDLSEPLIPKDYQPEETLDEKEESNALKLLAKRCSGFQAKPITGLHWVNSTEVSYHSFDLERF